MSRFPLAALAGLAAALALAAAPAAARADSITTYQYDVTIITELEPPPTGYSYDFQERIIANPDFADDTTATIYDALDPGGSIGPVNPSYSYDNLPATESGDLEGNDTTTLYDGDSNNVQLQEEFTPGTQFDFDLNITTHAPYDALESDRFEFSILECDPNNACTTVPTYDSSNDDLIRIEDTTPAPTVNTYDALNGEITAQVNPVPEPAPLVLLASGLLLGGLATRRRRTGVRL